MKRILICAAAAIVALASCSKTQVVYNDAPEEIGFKAVTGVMTKEPVTNTSFPEGQTMTVYAWNNDGHAAYFGPVVFAKDGESWSGGANPQYYPSIGALDFVAYANHSVVSMTTTPLVHNSYDYTLADNKDAQHDFMVSDYVVNNSKSGSPVTLPFHHALALIEINFKCTGTTVQINSVTLTNTKQQGTVSVSYTVTDEDTDDNTPEIGTWDVSAAPDKNCSKTGNIDLTADADFVNYARFLVVPESGANKTLTVSYTLNGNQFSHDIDVDAHSAHEWAVGTKHVFNITIGLAEITFSPNVVNWTDDSETIPAI